MKKRKHRGGRPRNVMAQRQPNGQVRREAGPLVPVEAMRQRAIANGLDLDAVTPEGVARLCQDQTAGAALGRIMWVHGADGNRRRRMLDGNTPLISDDMALAADEFRARWVAYHRSSGIPPRHARAADMGQVGATGEAAGGESATAARRYLEALDALDTCPSRLLVRAAVDSVVIEDEDRLLLDRPQALNALRVGLQALAEALVRGQRRAA